ncbi:ATP-binding protein [Alicyclobacillus fastidiosus]|uniref:histidine kinase n=1 Tax=Alicyclobacillus fastidiosus TaxID=392011 RepID=A0ABV5ALR9_9BACL|nr:ATP-binding protein [Alicyclobacillus fastidiosus]WEH11055.1 ATP-binding protein [Alicyclobacillus fastidiosus]
MLRSNGKEDENSQLHQLNRLLSVSEIAAGIAHEVKNPLTSVKGFLQLLHEKYADEYCEIAESELDNAISIITNFLQVARPNMDDEPYQEVNIATELESILDLFLDRQYLVPVIKEFQDTHITLYARRNQLKRALFNLLKNAFESIPDRGSIRIQHYAQGSQLVVVIQDTGVGIDEDKLPLLGTPFITTKDDGTGMGLPQVYSAVYQHGGSIDVESKKNVGTTFYIYLPIHVQEEAHLNTIMDVVCHPDQSIQQFIEVNKEKFRECLVSEQTELTYTIEEVKEIANIDLINNAFNLIYLSLNNRPHEVVTFAKREGKTWAQHSLKLNYKLEWVQTLRKVFWDFFYNYCRIQKEHNFEDFFKIERTVNYNLDTFLNHFNISYNQFKDEVLQTQRELVADLSVPIIPLTRTVSILPLIGTIDTCRAQTVQEKVLHQIELLQIETIIIDFSGIPYLDTPVVTHLIRLFDGIELMGCKTVLTGIRAEVANALVEMGVSIRHNVIKKGTLQQALESIGFNNELLAPQNT